MKLSVKLNPGVLQLIYAGKVLKDDKEPLATLLRQVLLTNSVSWAFHYKCKHLYCLLSLLLAGRGRQYEAKLAPRHKGCPAVIRELSSAATGQ